MSPSVTNEGVPPRAGVVTLAPHPVHGAATLARDPLGAIHAPVQSATPARSAQPAQRACRMLQRIDDASPERANRQAIEDLANGAEGLAIVFQGAPNAFGRGLPASQEALSRALRDVPLARTPLRLDLHPASRQSVDWLVRILAERKANPEKLDISFGIDPAALFAGTGMLRMSIEALRAFMPQSLAHYFVLGVPGILLEADGRVFHNAGASDAQELGIMLASAIGYLRMFEEARQPAIYAAAHIGFSMSVEQDRLRTRAKFAALRTLWGRILESYSAPAAPVAVHAETSYRMVNAAHSEANLIRNTLAALGAVEAGASTLASLPYDVALRLPEDTARRRTREALAILFSEGGASVHDGATDDALTASTDGLCDAAWDEFTRIEREGGILRSIQAGHVQQRVIAARDARVAQLAGSEVRVLPVSHAARNDPEGVAFCQRLDPVRWEELLAEAA